MKLPFTKWFNIKDYEEYLTLELNCVYIVYEMKNEKLIIYINGAKVNEIEDVQIEGEEIIRKKTFSIPGAAFKHIGNAAYN